MVLISEASKQIFLVSREDRIEEANERKRTHYTELVEECWSNGWRARSEPTEVGCRGLADQSLCRASNTLGIRGASGPRAIKLVTEAAKLPQDGCGSGEESRGWGRATRTQDRA